MKSWKKRLFLLLFLPLLARRFFEHSSRSRTVTLSVFRSSSSVTFMPKKVGKKEERKKEKMTQKGTKSNEKKVEKEKEKEREKESEREKRKSRTFSLRNKPRSWQVRSSLHFSASFIGVKRREKTRMEEIEWLHRGRLCYRNVSIFSIHIHRPPLHFYDLSAPGA